MVTAEPLVAIERKPNTVWLPLNLHLVFESALFIDLIHKHNDNIMQRNSFGETL